MNWIPKKIIMRRNPSMVRARAFRSLSVTGLPISRPYYTLGKVLVMGANTEVIFESLPSHYLIRSWTTVFKLALTNVTSCYSVMSYRTLELFLQIEEANSSDLVDRIYAGMSQYIPRRYWAITNAHWCSLIRSDV